jgi:hypothetical protein
MLWRHPVIQKEFEMRVPRRRLATAAALLLSAAWLIAPGTSLAADSPAPKANPNGDLGSTREGDAAKPVPRVITINVSDTGFDKKEYTVYTAAGQSGDYKDQVILNNTGTMVHTATIMPGDPNTLKALIGPDCSNGCKRGRFKTTRIFDTGGVAAGETFTFMFVSGADYSFTSATDCLNGNSTPGFDCTPSVIHVKGQQSTNLNDYTSAGTGIAAVGDPDCMVNVPAVRPNIGPAFCRLPFKRWSKTVGTSSKPVGDITSTIDDLTGFDPSVIYIQDGGTITWVNNGTRVHSVIFQTAASTSDWTNKIESGGLAPGASYSYTFCPPTTEDRCSRTFTVGSNIDLDRYPKAQQVGGDASLGKGLSLMTQLIFVQKAPPAKPAASAAPKS